MNLNVESLETELEDFDINNIGSEYFNEDELDNEDTKGIAPPPSWKSWLKEKDATNTKQAREKLPRKEYCPTCGQVDPVASGQQKEEGQSHGEQSTAARGGSTLYTDTDNDKEVFRETSPPMSGWKTGRTGGKGFRNALYNDLGDPRDYSHEYYQGQMSDSDDKGAMKKKAWEVWLDNVTKPIPDSKGGRGSFQHCIDANQDKNNPGGWCKQIERKISKAKKKKEVKLPQTKIDEPKHWWDHSKVGRQGDIDQKTGRPWWEVATEEKERRKRESKKIAEKPESDYYMDAGGNPQRKEKTDYFVEEIRSNIIYHNKILPIMGMIAGQAARGMGKMGKKIGSEVLEGAAEVGQGMLQGVGDEAEEEEQ